MISYIYILIVLVFIFYSYFNFKKAFLIFAVLRVILNSGIALRFSPPAISVDLVLCLYFTVFGLFKFKITKYSKTHINCFYALPFILMSISYVLSTIVALMNGNIAAVSMTLRTLICGYGFIYIFWYVCETKDDLKIFIKTTLIIFFVIYLYGIFEYLTNTNPILNIIYDNIPIAYSEDKLYISDLSNTNRGGRARFQSLFSISILYGVASVLFLFFLTNIKHLSQQFRIKKHLFFILSILAIFGCIVCNSKTPLVGLPIFLIPYLLKKQNAGYLIALTLLAAILPGILSVNQLIDLDSFNVNGGNAEDGSNLSMRLRQLEISINAFMQSPIFGNGIRYSSYLASTAHGAELLGAESCWFKLLIEQGLFGIISYILIMLSFIKASVSSVIPKSFRPVLFFYAIAFFVMASITDIGYEIFYVFFIVMFKANLRITQIHYDFIPNTDLCESSR